MFWAAVIVEERPVRPKPSTQAAHTRLVQSSGSASDGEPQQVRRLGLVEARADLGREEEERDRARAC